MNFKKLEQRCKVERAIIRAINEVPSVLNEHTRDGAGHVYRMVIAECKERGLIYDARLLHTGGIVTIGQRPTRGVIEIINMEAAE